MANIFPIPYLVVSGAGSTVCWWWSCRAVFLYALFTPTNRHSGGWIAMKTIRDWGHALWEPACRPAKVRPPCVRLCEPAQTCMRLCVARILRPPPSFSSFGSALSRMGFLGSGNETLGRPRRRRQHPKAPPSLPPGSIPPKTGLPPDSPRLTQANSVKTA